MIHDDVMSEGGSHFLTNEYLAANRAMRPFGDAVLRTSRRLRGVGDRDVPCYRERHIGGVFTP